MQKKKKIGVLIVAYNAVSTLRAVLDRIPPAMRDRIDEVFVFDDCSKDDTYLLGVGYKAETGWDKLKIYRNEQNLGYGGNQKKGYRYAIDNGFDIVVLLHGDGQYAPEIMADLVDPLERGEAEAVFGSRMMIPGAALRGKMPLYKYVGNKILTFFENRMLGMNLTEFHSGYRAYDVHALAKIPFEKNTNDFHFDTEIIIQFHQHKLRIAETPIPTYYGDEICHVNGMKYAKDVARAVIQYRLTQSGFRNHPQFEGDIKYPLKTDRHSSHVQIARRIQGSNPRILDVGCGPGNIGALLKNKNFEYVGVDFERPAQLHPHFSAFYERNIEQDFHFDYGPEFDYIVFGDILEHLREPEKLLIQAREYLKPDGKIIVSVPNITHWSVRLMMLTGNFVYMERGILDRTHLRFFTRRSMKKLLEECGFEPTEVSATPTPIGTILSGLSGTRFLRVVGAVQSWFANAWKNMFAYQLIFVARRKTPAAQPSHSTSPISPIDEKVSETPSRIPA